MHAAQKQNAGRAGGAEAISRNGKTRGSGAENKILHPLEFLLSWGEGQAMAFTEQKQNWILQTSSGNRALADLVENQAKAFYLYDLEDALQRADRFVKAGVS